MKAILVIDNMPSCCAECPLRLWDTESKWLDMCMPTLKERNPVSDEYMECDDLGKIPSWCPLKPMPLKRRSYVLWGTEYPNEFDYKTAKFISTHEISEYDKGWNDCVDMLEGE